MKGYTLTITALC